METVALNGRPIVGPFSFLALILPYIFSRIFLKRYRKYNKHRKLRKIPEKYSRMQKNKAGNIFLELFLSRFLLSVVRRKVFQESLLGNKF